MGSIGMDHVVQRNYRKMTIKWLFAKIGKIGFQDQLSLNAGQKNCRMLQRENSAILSTFIKLPFVIKIFVCLFLSGRFTQVLMYIQIHVITRWVIKELHNIGKILPFIK